MTDSDKTPEEKPPVTYATPVQRIWAWVGVVYMVIIVLLVTYYLAHLRFIAGIGQVLLVPALAGAAATSLFYHRETKALPWAILAFGGVALAIYNLIAGFPALLAAL